MSFRFNKISLVLLLALTACTPAFCDDAEKVSACQLKDDAGTFNHKLVQVTAFISQGFEDFSLQDPSCDLGFGIWLEYGGKIGSGTVYCCGPTARSRPKEIEVENITVPLVEDENFRKFDNLIRVPNGYAMVHATLVGRFFSGEQVQLKDGTTRWQGYGHLGCCSLLVIQQILAVDPHDRNDLDYAPFGDQPDVNKMKCGYQYLTPIVPYRELMAAQARAEEPDGRWAFDNPERVAVKGLATLLKVDEHSIKGIKVSKRLQGKIIYSWHPKGKKRYMLIVNRPYWLSFYSYDQSRVAWVLTAAYELCD